MRRWPRAIRLKDAGNDSLRPARKSHLPRLPSIWCRAREWRTHCIATNTSKASCIAAQRPRLRSAPSLPPRISGLRSWQGVLWPALFERPARTTAGPRFRTALWTNERICPVRTITTYDAKANNTPEPDSITRRRLPQIFLSIAPPPPTQPRRSKRAVHTIGRVGASGVVRHGLRVADTHAAPNWRTWALSWCRTLPPAVPSAPPAGTPDELRIGYAAVEDRFSLPTSRQRLAVGRRSFFLTWWASCGPHFPRRCVGGEFASDRVLSTLVAYLTSARQSSFGCLFVRVAIPMYAPNEHEYLFFRSE